MTLDQNEQCACKKIHLYYESWTRDFCFFLHPILEDSKTIKKDSFFIYFQNNIL